MMTITTRIAIALTFLFSIAGSRALAIEGERKPTPTCREILEASNKVTSIGQQLSSVERYQQFVDRLESIFVITDAVTLKPINPEEAKAIWNQLRQNGGNENSDLLVDQHNVHFKTTTDNQLSRQVKFENSSDPDVKYVFVKDHDKPEVRYRLIDKQIAETLEKAATLDAKDTVEFTPDELASLPQNVTELQTQPQMARTFRLRLTKRSWWSHLKQWLG